ncbi:acyltransferase [Pedobacter ureilyticus]|uniref:Acyltransferase n=1 Tax=Pedobacter ureilyticus TaxID=1393051 RepID=A0ABW9JCK3_9SPHI|nr:acyltransferase [Pedobacter helvus]
MTLGDYVKKRNGVPIGHPKSLGNNLYRSFGAKNFTTFWTFWNPIFGYYLGSKIFKPLKKVLPIGIALILTFIFCGLIHDLVTTLIRGKISLFFTIWFFIMGTTITISKKLSYDLSTALDFEGTSKRVYHHHLFKHYLRLLLKMRCH